jgi:3-phenylpropionate/cinnamic acid dioxygenase small subunit
MHQTALVKTSNAADENAVVTVLLRYAAALDSRDWPLFRSCFTEDLEADYGSFGRWRGPREITEYMRAAHRDLGATLHRISNISVWWDEGQLCARCYVDALLMPAEAGGSVHRGIGWYDDRLVRTSDGWRISRRTFHPVLLE